MPLVQKTASISKEITILNFHNWLPLEKQINIVSWPAFNSACICFNIKQLCHINQEVMAPCGVKRSLKPCEIILHRSTGIMHPWAEGSTDRMTDIPHHKASGGPPASCAAPGRYRTPRDRVGAEPVNMNKLCLTGKFLLKAPGQNPFRNRCPCYNSLCPLLTLMSRSRCICHTSERKELSYKC